MELIQQIRDAGIIGAGGAGFLLMQNSHHKLNLF